MLVPWRAMLVFSLFCERVCRGFRPTPVSLLSLPVLPMLRRPDQSCHRRRQRRATIPDHNRYSVVAPGRGRRKLPTDGPGSGCATSAAAMDGWAACSSGGSSTAARDSDQRLYHADDYFVTPPMAVYIEDTDAYGVMYNGNYLRAYDRALHSMVGVPVARGDGDATNVDTGASSPPLRSSVLHESDDWSIVSAEEIKFKSPPPLGGVFCIEGRRRRHRRPANDDDNPLNGEACASSQEEKEEEEKEKEVWDMTMRSPDGTIVYNTANGVTLARPPLPEPDSSYFSSSSPSSSSRKTASQCWLPDPEPLLSVTNSTMTSTVSTFRTYRDEFEPHLVTHLPLRNALNLMERSRTNYIGGPAALQSLQVEHDVLYVVTSARACSLVSYEGSTHGNCATATIPSSNLQPLDVLPPPLRAPSLGKDAKQTGPTRFVPGQSVDVETMFKVRKRGMIIDCYHTLAFDRGGSGDDDHNRVVAASDPDKTKGDRLRMAQGLVTIMALNATTRRPTQALPAWLAATFGID